MIGIALIEQCIKKNIEVLAIVRKKTKNISRLPVSKNVHILECDLEDLCNVQVNNKGYDVFIILHGQIPEKVTEMIRKNNLRI